MKVPEYNIIMILIYSGLTVTDGQKEKGIIVNTEVIKSKYTATVSDDYRYRGMV